MFVEHDDETGVTSEPRPPSELATPGEPVQRHSPMRAALLLLIALHWLSPLGRSAAPEPRSLSGIYPHLAMFGDEGECGTGGVVWLEDDVKAGVPSEPFLFSGFAHRSLFLKHAGATEVTFHLEVDSRGDGSWNTLRTLTVPPQGTASVLFAPAESGAWVRLIARTDAPQATAFFLYRAEDARNPQATRIVAGIAGTAGAATPGGLLHARGAEFMTLRFLARNADGDLGCYDLDGNLRLQRTNDPAGAAWTAKAVALPEPLITVSEGAALYVDA